jgi:hypothetical protein
MSVRGLRRRARGASRCRTKCSRKCCAKGSTGTVSTPAAIGIGRSGAHDYPLSTRSFR